MSMNLKCNLVSLWQTPPYITNMCLFTLKEGGVSCVTGKKARRALELYMIWARSTINGAWDSAGDLEMARETLKEHLAEIEDVINSNDLEVYEI